MTQAEAETLWNNLASNPFTEKNLIYSSYVDDDHQTRFEYVAGLQMQLYCKGQRIFEYLSRTDTITPDNPNFGNGTSYLLQVIFDGNEFFFELNNQDATDLITTADIVYSMTEDDAIACAAYTPPEFIEIPTGLICHYGKTTAPTGFLLCDGSAISRTGFAALFAVIGTSYGAGDGSTTFNVPKLDDDRFPMGATSVGTAGGANSLNLQHSHNPGTLATNTAGDHNHTGNTGANSGTPVAIGALGTDAAPNNHTHAIQSDGNHSHSITGATDNSLSASQDIRPKYLSGIYIIKT